MKRKKTECMVSACYILYVCMISDICVYVKIRGI